MRGSEGDDAQDVERGVEEIQMLKSLSFPPTGVHRAWPRTGSHYPTAATTPAYAGRYVSSIVPPKCLSCQVSWDVLINCSSGHKRRTQCCILCTKVPVMSAVFNLVYCHHFWCYISFFFLTPPPPPPPCSSSVFSLLLLSISFTIIVTSCYS